MDVEFDEKSGLYKIDRWKLLIHKYGVTACALVFYPTVIGVLCWGMWGESYIRIGVVCLLTCLLIAILIGELRELFSLKINVPSHHNFSVRDEINKALKDIGLV
tara:strand:- start:7904 stop:8215 length:312 start_codon:yes stop_codon:yes gene_type:complete